MRRAPRTTRRPLRLAAPLIALGLALTACGQDDPGTGTEASGHNDQDVAFATGMIPHHAQAVVMSQMAADHAESPEVRDLAAAISAAQEPEIEQMSAWLEEWGEEVPDTDGMGMGMGSGDHGDMDHGDMGGAEDMEGMPGMMSAEDLDELGRTRGMAFDTMFLTMMIEHHEGAIEMARTEQSGGEFPDALALAETIEQTQTEEIATMRELLDAP